MTCTLVDSTVDSETQGELKQDDINDEILILKKVVCGNIVLDTLNNVLDHLPKPNGKFVSYLP